MLKTPLLIIILLLQLAMIGIFLMKYPETTDQIQKKYDDLSSKSSMDETPQRSRDSSSNPQVDNSLATNESGSEAESKNVNNTLPPTDNTKSSELVSQNRIH